MLQDSAPVQIPGASSASVPPQSPVASSSKDIATARKAAFLPTPQITGASSPSAPPPTLAASPCEDIATARKAGVLRTPCSLEKEQYPRKKLPLQEPLNLSLNAESTAGALRESRQAPQPCECTAALHTCTLNEHSGCPSCHRTCHQLCDSTLCEYTPCAICASCSLVTDEQSPLCIAAQTDNLGCHACGRLLCWFFAPNCHSKCLRHKHVCGNDNKTGCDRCGHLPR